MYVVASSFEIYPRFLQRMLPCVRVLGLGAKAKRYNFKFFLNSFE
jgi:hypothetical protein